MTTIVFGGSSGIGNAIIEDLINKGHDDIVNIDITPSSIASSNISGDLSCDDFIRHVSDKLNSIKTIDAIIWSVRFRHFDDLSDIDIARKAFDVEVFSLITILSLISSKLIADGPSIVILSSIASKFVSSQHFSYNLVKAAQESLVRAMAVKYGEISLARFNSICPGIVDIPGRSKALTDITSKADVLRMASVPRMTTVHVKEISRLCSFLVSNDSSSLNGVTLFADGGESILDQYFVAQRTFNHLS